LLQPRHTLVEQLATLLTSATTLPESILLIDGQEQCSQVAFFVFVISLIRIVSAVVAWRLFQTGLWS